jgi:hypothetical protein
MIWPLACPESCVHNCETCLTGLWTSQWPYHIVNYLIPNNLKNIINTIDLESNKIKYVEDHNLKNSRGRIHILEIPSEL